MEQQPLPGMPPAPPRPERPDMDARFAAYHKANPHIFRELRRLALQVKRAGKRVGLKALWEQLRWQTYVESSESDPKLNNDFTSRYARLLDEKVPELRGFFETRARAKDREEGANHES